VRARSLHEREGFFLERIASKRGRWTHDSEFGAAIPYALETRRLPSRDAIRTVTIARAAEQEIDDALTGHYGRGERRITACAEWSAESKFAWARALMELLLWVSRPVGPALIVKARGI
jgi:hypothetical protein